MAHTYSRELYFIDGKHLVYPANTPRKLYTIGYPPYGRLTKLFVQENPVASGGSAAMPTNFKVRLYDKNWAINAPAEVSSASGTAFPIGVGTVFTYTGNSGFPSTAGSTFYADLYWTMGGLASSPAYPTFASGRIFVGSGQGVMGSGATFGTVPALRYGRYADSTATSASATRSGAVFGGPMFGQTERITSRYQGQLGAMLNIKFTAINGTSAQVTTLGTLAMSGDLAPAGWATNLPLPTTGGLAPSPVQFSPPGQLTVATDTTTYSIFNPGSLYIAYLPTMSGENTWARPFIIVDGNTSTNTGDVVNTLDTGGATAFAPAHFYSAYGIPFHNKEGSYATPKRQLYLEIDCAGLTAPTCDVCLDVELVCEPTGFAS